MLTPLLPQSTSYCCILSDCRSKRVFGDGVGDGVGDGGGGGVGCKGRGLIG